MNPILMCMSCCRLIGCCITRYENKHHEGKNCCGCKLDIKAINIGFRKSLLFENIETDKMISTRDDEKVQKQLPKNIMKFRKYNFITFIP